MKMKAKNYYLLMFHVIIVFMIIMICSLVPDKLHELFGDHYCSIRNCKWINDMDDHVLPDWHWGFRHFIWVFMGIVLFIIQIFRIIFIFKDKEL